MASDVIGQSVRLPDTTCLTISLNFHIEGLYFHYYYHYQLHCNQYRYVTKTLRNGVN